MSVAAPAPRTPLRQAWVPWAGLVARLVLAGVFLAAGLLKVTEPVEAGKAVQAYRLLPPELARTIGYALPTIEICLAVLLILGLFTRVAAALTGILLVAFVIGIASVWARGYSIDCGCFGSGGDISAAGRNKRYATEIARDVGLALLAAFLVWRPRTALSVDGWISPRQHHRYRPLDETDHLDDLDDIDELDDTEDTDDTDDTDHTDDIEESAGTAQTREER